jgi:hypothetical protein
MVSGGLEGVSLAVGYASKVLAWRYDARCERVSLLMVMGDESCEDIHHPKGLKGCFRLGARSAGESCSWSSCKQLDQELVPCTWYFQSRRLETTCTTK